MLPAVSQPALPPAPPAEQLVFDLAAPFPTVLGAREAARRHDYDAIRQLYASTEAWDLRTALIRTAAEVTGLEGVLQQQRRRDPADLTAALLLAAHHIELGWAARSGARAEYVSGDQFAVFHDHLRIAERQLIEVTAYDPGNLAAWTFRLMTARGLQLGQSEARRRYDQAAKQSQHHLAAQTQLLQQLCPKWGGSLEQLHAFATEKAYASPPGTLNAVLVVEAHLEHWATLSGRPAGAYLANPTVRADVVRAAAHSVLNPAAQAGYSWVVAHSYFALYFSLCGDHAAAAVHFRAMGAYAAVEPWTYYLPNARERYVQHRTLSLRKGSR